MFERYDEKARRTIFFSRHEASQTGSHTIESLHLLMGILKENGTLFTLANQDVSINSLMEECQRALPVYGEKLPTSVDIPLSNECKRALAEAANQAAILGSSVIRPFHLLLGLIEVSSDAAAILERHGMTRKTLVDPPKGLRAEAAALPVQAVLEFVCQGQRIAMSPIGHQNTIPRAGEEVVFTHETKMDTYRVMAIRHEFDGSLSESSVNCTLNKVVVECERVG